MGGEETMLLSALARDSVAHSRGFCRAAPGTTAPSIVKPNVTRVAPSIRKEVDLRHEIVDPVSGIPESQLSRKVYIFSPTKSAMQSGAEKIGMWKIEFENPERWRNPLMGYVSSADPSSNLKMKFPTKESALAYAEKMGYDYELQESVYPEECSNDRDIVKSYSDVFKFKGKKLRKRVFSV